MINFYVVATPIGNLGDMSERAITTLRDVDLILCEDTRVTKKLLDHYNIKTQTSSYHQHSKISKIEKIIEMVREGKKIALVSDAGTPGISDPGGKLVEALVKEFSAGINIVPIPGASAVAALLSVSGFPADKYVFMGFPPHKKGRQKYFKEIAKQEYTVVFYESTHRILKSLAELAEEIGERPVVVGRELTKKFESVYRGTSAEVIELLKMSSIKGEFAVAIKSK